MPGRESEHLDVVAWGAQVPQQGAGEGPWVGRVGSGCADGEVGDQDGVSSSGGEAQHLSEGRVAGQGSLEGRENEVSSRPLSATRTPALGRQPALPRFQVKEQRQPLFSPFCSSPHTSPGGPQLCCGA